MTIPTPDASAAAVKLRELAAQEIADWGERCALNLQRAAVTPGYEGPHPCEAAAFAADLRDKVSATLTASHAQLVETVERLIRERDELIADVEARGKSIVAEFQARETAEAAAARLREALQWAAATFDDYTRHASAKICRDAALASAAPPDARKADVVSRLRERLVQRKAHYEGEAAKSIYNGAIMAMELQGYIRLIDEAIAPPDGKENE